MADDTTMTTQEQAATETAAAPQETPAVEVDEGALAPRPNILEKLQGVPVAIRKYLLSDDLAALHKKVFDEHGISKDDRDLVYYTELQTFFGDIALADFPDRAWNRVTWEDAQEEKFAAMIVDILGWVFLPAQAHVGDVAGLITELGGDVKKYPEKQLEMRKISFVDGAREIAADAAIDGLNDDMRRRLAHIIESRLRVIRDDMETKEMLMKPKKTGGMELSEADAGKVMEMLGRRMRMTVFSEQVEEKKSPEAGAAPAVPAASAPQKEFTAIEIKKIYGGTPEEQEALKKRIQRFTQVTEGDAAKMRDAYYQVLFPPDLRETDPLYVVAGLLAMADGDQFSDALGNDDRYRDIVVQYLKDKGRDAEIDAYQADPAAPAYMNVALQLLLRGIAGYDEAESARFGLRVTNALKKFGYDRYVDLVAFDVDKGEFRWKDQIET